MEQEGEREDWKPEELLLFGVFPLILMVCALWCLLWAACSSGCAAVLHPHWEPSSSPPGIPWMHAGWELGEGPISKPEHQAWKTKWHPVSEVPEVPHPPFFLHQRCCWPPPQKCSIQPWAEEGPAGLPLLLESPLVLACCSHSPATYPSSLTFLIVFMAT